MIRIPTHDCQAPALGIYPTLLEEHPLQGVPGSNLLHPYGATFLLEDENETPRYQFRHGRSFVLLLLQKKDAEELRLVRPKELDMYLLILQHDTELMYLVVDEIETTSSLNQLRLHMGARKADGTIMHFPPCILHTFITNHEDVPPSLC